MVTVNVDIQDMLINGQVIEVVRFEIKSRIVKKVYLKFQDPLVGRNAMLSDRFAQQNYFVPLHVIHKYQYVKALSHLASSKRNFHLCCHGHVQ